MTVTIEGTVTDHYGAPLPGVVVAAVESSTGSVLGQDETDPFGEYSIGGLYNTTCDVTARKLPYKTGVKEDYDVGTTGTITVDFSLRTLEPKVIGDTSTETDIGVRGVAAASSGEPIGVWGSVATSDGWGFYTPNDARIDGTVDSFGTWIVDTANRFGYTGNVVQGGPDHSHSGGPDGQTISGGESHVTDGIWSTVGGGGLNEATGYYATVSGGKENVAGSPGFEGGTVGGGILNEASGKVSTVPGGTENVAAGDYSFAAGRQARADHDGAVVVGDSTTTTVSSSTQDEVVFQAGGGLTVQAPSIDLQGQLFSSDGGLHLTGSDLVMSPAPPSGAGYDLRLDNGTVVIDTSSARYKTAVQPLGDASEQVLDLEPRTFEYVDRSGGRELGLIAEEVDESVPELVIRDEEGRPDAVKYDRIGACLVPEVRENRERVEELEAENQALRAELGESRSAVEARDEQIDELERRMDDLTGRLATLESRIEDSTAGSAD